MTNFLGGILDWFGTPRRDARVMARVEAEKRQRLAEMAADPVRAKYVPRILRGEHWRDEDIAFNEDPNATHVCEHLRPIERLMRITGIGMHIGPPNRLSADCMVDRDGFDLGLRPPPSVVYLEVPHKERSLLDPDIAMIMCRNCESIIYTVHAESAKPDTPSFPR